MSAVHPSPGCQLMHLLLKELKEVDDATVYFTGDTVQAQRVEVPFPR